MKKKLMKILMITIGFLVSFLCLYKSGVVYAEEKAIYISSTGNDDTGDGSETNPYSSMQKAIFIASGDQTNNYTFNVLDSVKLSGIYSFPDNVIVTPSAALSVDDYAEVNGLKIANASSLIQVSKGAHLILKNSEIYNNSGKITNRGKLDIEHSYFKNNTDFRIRTSGSTAVTNFRESEVLNNVSMSYGGCLDVWSEGTLNFYSGKISNNEAYYDKWYNRYDSLSHSGIYIGRSGGVVNMYGGEISSNKSLSGSAVYADQRDTRWDQTTKRYYPIENAAIPSFYMYGGRIEGNTAINSAGGIFIQSGAYAEIHKGQILNNTVTNGWASFTGGGIYVNGGFEDIDYYGNVPNGVLKIYNAAILNNSVKNNETLSENSFQYLINQGYLSGGGIASCPTTKTIVNIDDGAFIYGNNDYYGKSDIFVRRKRVQQFDRGRSDGVESWWVYAHNGEKMYVPSHSADSDFYNWKVQNGDSYDNYGETMDLTLTAQESENANDINIYSDRNYTEEELQAILSTKDVIIKDNISYGGNGGGIGSNGDLYIGNTDTSVTQTNISAYCHECIVEQPEEINVTLYDKNDDKIKDLKLLKSENYSASITGLADLDGYYVEQESLGEDKIEIYRQKPVYISTRADGKTVKNIDIEILNECKQETTGTSAKLKKYLVMKENAIVPNMEFTFAISAGEGNDPATNSAAVYPGITPSLVKINGTAESGTVTFTNRDETTTGALEGVAESGEKYAMKDINLDFSAVKFPEPGVYRYVLTEQPSSWSAITNDSEPVRVIDVHVVWNEDETKMIIGGYVSYKGNVTDAPKLMPEFTYEYQDTDGNGEISEEEKEAQADAYSAAYSDFIASIQDGSGKPAGSYVNAGNPIGVEAGEKSDMYVNKYKTQDLVFSKEVTGNMGSKDQYFEFTVTLNNMGNETNIYIDPESNFELSTQENAYTKHAKATMDATNGVDENKQIDYQQLVANSSGTINKKFYLQHGQSIKLTGIPIGATYTITETESNQDGFTTTGEVVSPTVITDTDSSVNIVNHKSGIVPTGIVKNIVTPVIIASLAGAYFLLKARRTKELK